MVSISIYGDRDCTSLHADDGSPVATHGFRPKRVVASAGWTRPGRVTTSVSQSISQSSESYVLSWLDIHVRSTTTGRFYDNLAAHAHPIRKLHHIFLCTCTATARASCMPGACIVLGGHAIKSTRTVDARNHRCADCAETTTHTSTYQIESSVRRSSYPTFARGMRITRCCVVVVVVVVTRVMQSSSSI